MSSQREIALSLLMSGSILRLAELRADGVTAATISRMERGGEVVRLARGLYQHPDASVHLNHSMAEVAKRTPRGVVCLISALGVSRDHSSASQQGLACNWPEGLGSKT